MKRQQVFVRAQDETGKWGSADALDLDQSSFNAFVLDMLGRCGLVVMIRDEVISGEHLIYRTRSGFRFDA